MKEILIEPQRIRDAINQFRNIITKSAIETKRAPRTFRGGGYTVGVEYTLESSLGKFLVLLPDEDRWSEGVVPHLFNLKPKGNNYTTDVELNIPMGLDRSVGGCYIIDDKNLFIGNRGIFTVINSRVKKQVVMKCFEDLVVRVQDYDKESEIIEIASLSDDDCIEKLAKFTHRIKKLKFKIKIENQDKGMPF